VLSIAQDVTVFKMIALFGVFGIGLLVFAVFVVALATKRNGIAATLGALLLAGFGLSALFLLFRSVEVYTPPQISVPLTAPSAPSAPRLEISSPQIDHASYGRISFFGLLLAVGFLGFVIAGVLKVTKKCDGGGHNWSALLLIPLAFFVVMGGVRVTKTTHVNANPAPPVVNTFPAPPAPPVAQADVHHQIEHGDIHVLMDKADAPRIDLKAEAAAGVAVMSVAETQNAEQSKDAVADSEKVVTAETTAIETEPAATDETSDAEKPTAAEEQDEVTATAIAAKSSDTDAKSDDLADDDGEEPKAQPVPNSTEAAQNSPATSLEVEIGSADEPKPSKPLPEWVEQQPARVGEVRREVIATDEYSSVDECYEARDIYMLLRTYEHIQRLVGLPYRRTTLPSLSHGNYFVQSDGTEVDRHGEFDPGEWQFAHSSESVWNDPRLQALQAMGVGIDYVQREIAKEEYIVTNDRSFGPMKKLYTLMEFSPAVDRELRAHWENYERKERLASVGVGAGGILGLLGFVYGLLKIDTLTKGYYTKRLFIGVPAAIIGGTVLLSLIVRFSLLPT
jgi:hypothetical protein